MPYQIRKGAGGCKGFAVVKEGTETVVGCHPTQSKAVAQMRALHANVADASSTRDDSLTRPTNEAHNQPVQNPLARFMRLGQAPVEGDADAQRMAMPEAAVAEYRPLAGATTMAAAEAAEAAHEVEREVNELTYMFSCVVSNILGDPAMKMPAKIDALQAAIDDLGTRVGKIDLEDTKAIEPDYAAGEMDGTIKSTVSPDGTPRWVAVYSNRYKDRLRETLPEAAHRDFVEYVERTKAYPTLRLWHVPGADIGVADWIDYSDGFMVATGTYYRPEYAERLKEAGPLRCSHGFKYRVKDFLPDGTYRAYRTYEISVLPAGREANTLQADFDPGEALMLTAARREFVERVLGADKVKEVEQMLTSLKAKADAEGLAYREIMDTFATFGEKADAPPEAPPPAAGVAEVTAAQVQAAMAPLTEALNGLNARLDAQAVQVKAVADSQAEIREAMRMAAPRSSPAVGGFVASTADATRSADDIAAAAAAAAAAPTGIPEGTPAHLAPYVKMAQAALGGTALNGAGGAA